MNYMPHFVSFQQRTATNYLAQEKTEPFPKTPEKSHELISKV